MKKIWYLAVLFLVLSVGLLPGKTKALESISPVDGTKITLTFNKTTAVADGSDTINFWYGAYYTVKTPLSLDCSDGATTQNPLPATITATPDQLCRSAAFSNKMTLVITGTGNNVSPNPLGQNGGILPDYNLISGTAEFTLKSSSPGEKVITYSASSLLPGGPTLTLSTTVNFIPNTAGSGTDNQSNTTPESNSQTTQTGSSQVSSTSGNTSTSGNESTATPAATTTATADDGQVKTSDNSAATNSSGDPTNLIYYIAGAALILLIGLILFWYLYARKKSIENSSPQSQKQSKLMTLIFITTSLLMVIFIATSAWLFIQNKNLNSDKKKLETDLSSATSELDEDKAVSDKKMTNIANKIEVMSLIFGPYSHEQNNFNRAGDLIKAMNNETLTSDWSALQANRGQATGEKLMSDLISATINDLK